MIRHRSKLCRLHYDIVEISISAIESLVPVSEKPLLYDIHIFNLNCPKEGWELDDSGGMMHAFSHP